MVLGAEMNIKSIASAVFIATFLSFVSSSSKADTIIFGSSGTDPVQLILNGTTTVTLSYNAYLYGANSGWYSAAGFHSSDNLNYAAGVCCSVNPPVNDKHDYFVFNLSNVSGPITSATLSIFNPNNGFYTNNGASGGLYQTWDVSTPLSTLKAGQTNATSIYTDLGSGTLFGSVLVGPSDDNAFVNITLDSAAIAAINASEGSQFAVGGSLVAINAVPEPSTWAMMILGFAGIGYMAYRRKNGALHVA